MKKILSLVILLAISITVSISVAFADVWVNGYYRSNGTYVEGYYRSSPDSDPTNNFSYPGNTNPYTGAVAPGNPDTYINNYNKNSSGNSTLNSLQASQDKLKQDQEAQKKSIEATQLRNKIDSLANQIKQNSSGNACYYPAYSSCSETQRQGIMTEWEQAKSRVSAMNFKSGIVGSSAEEGSYTAVNNEYSSKLKMCQDQIDANNRLIDLYNQCKINQSNSQAELLRLQQQYQETSRTIETQSNNSTPTGQYIPISERQGTPTTCASGSYDLGNSGYCTSYSTIVNLCKQVFGENSTVANIDNTGATCGCKAGYNRTGNDKCVPIVQKTDTTPVSYTDWVNAGKPDKNGVTTEAPKVPKIVKPSVQPTATPKKIKIDPSLSTSTISTSTRLSVIASTTSLTSTSSIATPTVKTEERLSVFQRLGGWFRGWFK